MPRVRLIARIDVKNEFAIKGIHLEGLRKVGNPNLMALDYYQDGIDEIVFMDAVAAYYDRNSLNSLIQEACKNIFVPIIVGGGIRTIEDIQKALQSGADKVAINTKSIQDPSFISRAAKIFGSQCIVSSIEAKLVDNNKWEAYVENGREPTGMDVVEWAKRVEELGAGEILLTSIDKEGVKKGFDIDLYQCVVSKVSIPVIASGGAGKSEDIVELLKQVDVDAVATASIIHYKSESIQDIKGKLLENQIQVRV